MRIIHYLDSLRVGGKERQHVELIKGLSEIKKVKQLVITMDSDNFYLPELQRINIEVMYIIRSCRWDPFIFFNIYRVIAKFKPNIIHTNAYLTTFYALPIACLKNIILINGSIRNCFKPTNFKLKFERILLQLSNYRVSNSNAGLISRGFNISNRKNIVIYNGFDLNRLNIVDSIETSTRRKIIAMVAEFNDNKDYETFISAAKILIKNRNDATFWLIGDGKNLAKIKNLVDCNEKRIKFFGKINNVEAYIKAIDIGVLSTYSEGISNSIMEYMAFKKPVLASIGGANNEIVIHGKTGFLVPQKSPDLLAEKIEFLLDNQDVANKMGKEGRSLIEKKFSFKKMYENYLYLYEQSLKK